MNPVVNIEEKIGKTVGRRTVSSPLVVRKEETESNAAWRRIGFGSGIPKGVYRFHSHQEADRWLMNHLTGKQAN